MKFFPALGDDPLDAQALPNTDDTELNYRTRPLAAEQEVRLALLVLVAPVPILVMCAAAMNWLLNLSPFFDFLFITTLVVLAIRLVWLGLIGSLMRGTAVVAGMLSLSFMFGTLWKAIDPSVLALVSMLAAWLLCAAIEWQVAAWILAGPQVDHERMCLWRESLPALAPTGLSLECPELLSSALSVLLLGPAWWLSGRAAMMTETVWMWPLCFVATLHAVWLVVHVVTVLLVPWPNWRKSWRMTLRAFVVFATYDPFQTRAAGVFRFPTRILRPVLNRWSIIVTALMLLAFTINDGCSMPSEASVAGWSFFVPLVSKWALMSVTAPLILLSVLWFVAGAVLARFDEELSKPAPSGASVWDNYVDRIVNSSNELEREHLFVGTSLGYDYPVLVHREIHDQHMHILGDSGASKTSLGIAPQVTQLIAHADSTVVVVDLKGDKALFEACRLEAARTKRMKFRWLCNEVGKTSFAFNPFLQSHNLRLSVEQFSQQILQGLSLDYGLEYGAGFFTAMNEIVLSTVLNNAKVQSFRELDQYLSDREWYAQFGHKSDWNQARHLNALVSRLAANEPINVVPGRYESEPEVHAQAIDCLNVFNQPQVIYLWLRSPVEPTNAPTIARLFLWAMFTAASQRSGSNRVYFFVDEVQQVISEGIKLIFEQFRDLGGTLIASHQTAGQLRRYGSDLGDTIDSCTAVKQVYRASDLNSLERLEKLAGSRLTKIANWVQPYEAGTGDLIERFHPEHAENGLINVKQVERANLDRQQLLEIGSHRLASLMRFTFGSGYTQFAGGMVPILSQYPISFDEYQARRRAPWPTAPGAFRVPLTSAADRNERVKNVEPAAEPDPAGVVVTGGDQESAEEYLNDFDRRGRQG